MFLTMSDILVVSEACLAFSDEKNGVSKVIQWTLIPCFLNTSADSMLSRPPEHKPNAVTFFKDKSMLYQKLKNKNESKKDLQCRKKQYQIKISPAV